MEEKGLTENWNDKETYILERLAHVAGQIIYNAVAILRAVEYAPADPEEEIEVTPKLNTLLLENIFAEFNRQTVLASRGAKPDPHLRECMDHYNTLDSETKKRLKRDGLSLGIKKSGCNLRLTLL